MSIYLTNFYIRKPAGSPPIPAACLPSVGISPNNEFAHAFLKHKFSMFDIQPLMIAANLTLGEVIWLFFELVLLVLRTRTDKTAVIYIEVALYNP